MTEAATATETAAEDAALKAKAEKAAAKEAKLKEAAEAEAKRVETQKAQSRKKLLDAAANEIGMNIKNSADQLMIACVHDHPEIIRDQWALLEQRVAAAKKLITDAGIKLA